MNLGGLYDLLLGDRLSWLVRDGHNAGGLQSRLPGSTQQGPAPVPLSGVRKRQSLQQSARYSRLVIKYTEISQEISTPLFADTDTSNIGVIFICDFS